MLSDANSRKERLIHLLFKDERSKLNEHSNLLEAMALGKVLKRESTKNFEAKLEEHQKVRFPDGYTSLEKALIEHNIKVLSKIYLNITFSELGMFLGITA
jgi:COP9 signalosome complex subunit 4